MKHATGWLRARQFLEHLTESARYHSGSADAQAALGGSATAARMALARLAKQGAIASPARGFYVLAAAETAPVPWAQRLGYLLECAEAAHKAGHTPTSRNC